MIPRVAVSFFSFGGFAGVGFGAISGVFAMAFFGVEVVAGFCPLELGVAACFAAFAARCFSCNSLRSALVDFWGVGWVDFSPFAAACGAVVGTGIVSDVVFEQPE